MSFRNRSNDRESGFTFIEILLAVSILATIAVLVSVAFSSTFSTLEAVRQDERRQHQARMSLSLIAQELMSGYRHPSVPWIGQDGEEGGEPADLVAFVSAGYVRYRTNVPGSDLIRVLYVREGDRLVRLSTRHLHGLSLESVEQVELAQGVMGFNVRYLDQGLKTWVNEWDGQRQKELPRAVMIELTLKNSRNESQTFTEWVTIPPQSL